MMKPKLIIFDESLLYAEGLSKLLVQNKIFSSVEIFNCYEKFTEHLKKEPPEFLMIGTNTMLLTEIHSLVQDTLLQHNSTKIIVIGHSFDISSIRKLFNKGIKCYLDKNSPYEELVKSISTLLNDDTYVCDHVKEMMINYISHEEEKHDPHVRESLTKRELEILKHICNGLSSKDISEKLFISINTVETHRKRILMKLNVKNSVGVVKYALENNIFN
ncbi:MULTISPECIES: response regulator transcription factor [Chryseobacterium]|uniref:Nitrogen regulation protein C n=1 Tax=Chryseobacterium taihuense TaxID=1141221 RepID=A0A4U8WHM0_9FLAO|nr:MULTISPECIES: response regulator transcription factor [Chryseobacterium]VFB05296.1 Nitrogen regulation protein C [Chryseobacterium taihuense]